MAKDLYEEALADVKRLKKLAEDNAKLALIEACTPRIREFIESQLMADEQDDEDFDGAVDIEPTNGAMEPAAGDSTAAPTTPGLPEPQGDLLADNEHAQASAVSMPDEEGKVTLDIDAVAKPGADDGQYEVNLESLEDLAPIAEAAKRTVLGRNILSIFETVRGFKGVSKKLKATDTFQEQITNVLSRVENIYGYVQENVKNPAEKLVHENKLEAIFKDLNELQEQKMKTKRKLTEEDVSLTITGLPDDIDLDSLGVDLVSGDDEGDQGDQGDQSFDDADDQGGDDQGADVDFDSLGGGDQDDDMDEGDQMIEIDENMLRQEIKRMRKNRAIRENEHKQGKADDADVLHDFGGGEDDGDPWEDHDVRVAPHGHMNENEAMDEGDELSEVDLSEDDMVDEAEVVQTESRISKRLKEMHKKAAGKSVSARRSSEHKIEEALRSKLAETNLFNAKLVYANKLLQSESLSKRQKAQVIERLEKAKTVREVKIVYQGLLDVLTSRARPIKESAERKVLGSSSRATKPSSTQISEGFETSRWARLAGLKD